MFIDNHSKRNSCNIDLRYCGSINCNIFSDLPSFTLMGKFQCLTKHNMVKELFSVMDHNNYLDDMVSVYYRLCRFCYWRRLPLWGWTVEFFGCELPQMWVMFFLPDIIAHNEIQKLMLCSFIVKMLKYKSQGARALQWDNVLHMLCPIKPLLHN